MKKIIYTLALILMPLVLKAQTQQGTYIYRNYSQSIVRTPYPQFVIQGNYIYRTYDKSIVRVPYPQYTIKNDYIYRNYDKSLVRMPYPIGTVANGIPQ